MRKWLQRALIYKFFSILPRGGDLFEILRTKQGSLKNFDVERRNYAVEEMSSLLKQANKVVEGKTLVEIGAGWHPVLPALFYGMGASRVLMTDISPHIEPKYIIQVLDYLISNVAEIAKIVGTPESQLREKWQELYPPKGAWSQEWAEKGIEYYAPFDFTKSSWRDAFADMVYSNSCLGYIPIAHLPSIFLESYRILKPHGWIAHDISLYDDYSVGDNSISPLNFLNYSKNVWEFVGNSSLHYQNRRRPAYYIELAKSVSFQVCVSERLPRHIKLGMLKRCYLHSEFRDLSDEELLCAHLLLLAEKM